MPKCCSASGTPAATRVPVTAPLGEQVAALFRSVAPATVAGIGSVLLLPEVLAKPLRDDASNRRRSTGSTAAPAITPAATSSDTAAARRGIRITRQ